MECHWDDSTPLREGMSESADIQRKPRLRTARDVLADAREVGEIVRGPFAGDDSVQLSIGAATFAVSDECEPDGQIDGYTWATYATGEDLAHSDYVEHDGGVRRPS